MTGPTSVCLITGEYPPAVGGIADYTASLARSLQGEGMTVSVYTTLAAGDPVGEPDGIRILGTPGWGIGSIRAVAKAVASTRAEIVHLQYQAAAFAMSPALLALPHLLRAHGRTAFITTFHDLRPPYLFPKAGPLRHWFNYGLIGASDAVVFTDASDLTRAHPRRPAAWIPIGSSISPPAEIDRDAARQRFGIAPDEAVVASFGFVNASKGLETLLRSADRLVRGGVPLRLLLIGDETGTSDPRNQKTAATVRALAGSLELGERVIRTGLLAPGDVSTALAAADLAALPYVDGASLRRSSLLTCLAHGLPVVTTRPAAAARLTAEDRVALFDDPAAFHISPDVVAIVPREDDAALARELYRLLNDPARAERLGAAGKELAGRLDWASIGQATRQVYRRALGERP